MTRPPHPLPRSARPAPERLTVTVAQIEAFMVMRVTGARVAIFASNNNSGRKRHLKKLNDSVAAALGSSALPVHVEPQRRNSCKACAAAATAEERLRRLFQLPAWELVVAEQVESVNDRAAFQRFRALEYGVRFARRLERAAAGGGHPKARSEPDDVAENPIRSTAIFGHGRTPLRTGHRPERPILVNSGERPRPATPPTRESF